MNKLSKTSMRKFYKSVKAMRVQDDPSVPPLQSMTRKEIPCMMMKLKEDGRSTLKIYQIPLGRTICKSAHMPQHISSKRNQTSWKRRSERQLGTSQNYKAAGMDGITTQAFKPFGRERHQVADPYLPKAMGGKMHLRRLIKSDCSHHLEKKGSK